MRNSTLIILGLILTAIIFSGCSSVKENTDESSLLSGMSLFKTTTAKVVNTVPMKKVLNLRAINLCYGSDSAKDIYSKKSVKITTTLLGKTTTKTYTDSCSGRYMTKYFCVKDVKGKKTGYSSSKLICDLGCDSKIGACKKPTQTCKEGWVCSSDGKYAESKDKYCLVNTMINCLDKGCNSKTGKCNPCSTMDLCSADKTYAYSQLADCSGVDTPKEACEYGCNNGKCNVCNKVAKPAVCSSDGKSVEIVTECQGLGIQVEKTVQGCDYGCANGACKPKPQVACTTKKCISNGVKYVLQISCSDGSILETKDCGVGYSCYNNDCHFTGGYMCKDTNSFGYINSNKEWSQMKYCPLGCSDARSNIEKCQCRNEGYKYCSYNYSAGKIVPVLIEEGKYCYNLSMQNCPNKCENNQCA